MRPIAHPFRILLLLTVLIVTLSQSVLADGKVVFGWVTFSDTKWPAPYSGGNIPADSLPWDALTHVGLFAANGNTPPQSYYINQYGAFTTRAHQSGVFAGITVGGSSDGALVSMVGDPTSWTNWITTYLSYLDANKMDFIEFDFEGSYSSSNIGGFFTQLYDSLQLRQSGNDPSRHPFIVLTAGVSHAISWSSQTIRDRVEFVNLMTYDYNNNAWGRVTFDNSPKSYKYYNGTGGATDSVGTGVNAIAPSMQRMAIRVNAAGWPMSKLNVGMDYNGGYWDNATVIRQSTSGTSSGGSDATFAGNWSAFSQLPADSIFFDQIAQAYWARVGTRLWTWLSLPGRDSGVIATRKVVDSMGLAGVCIWNLGNEIWNASPVPPGGKGWFYSQIRKHFNFSGVQPPPPPPPAVDTTAPSVGFLQPANGASLTGTVAVQASASDNVGVSYVQFLLDNAALGGPDYSSPYSFSWNTDSYTDGSHTLSAVAYDAAGNQGRKDISVVLTTPPPPPADTVAPNVSITAPANGDTLTGTVAVQASATDNAGVSYVQFLLDNAALGGQDNSAPYTVSWNTDNVPDGSHTLSAIARDAAGLQARNDITVWVTSPPPPPPPPPDTIPAGADSITLFGDAVASPWINGSWSSTTTFGSTERVYAGSAAIKAVQSAWGAVSLHSGSWASPVPVNLSPDDELRLAVFPESVATFRVELQNDLGDTFGYAMLNQVPSGRWSTFVIPLSTLNPGNHVIHQVTFQNYLNRQVTYHLDELRFVTSGGDTSGSSGGVASVPVLLAPADGDTNVPVNPTFNWQSSGTGLTFDLQVATDQLFTQVVADSRGLTSGSATPGTFQYGALYYWRARSIAGMDTSAWSQTFSFTTASLVPTLKYDRLFVDFGTVGIGDQKTDSVRVVNDNDFTVEISNVRTTSGRFSAQLEQTSIPAKSSRKLYVKFAPDRKATETDVVISISGVVTRIDTVSLRGTGGKKSRGRFSRGTIVVGHVEPEETVSDSFYVSNDGDVPLEISSVTTTHASIGVSPTSAEIGPYDSLLFRVSISPATPEAISGYVVITPVNGPADSIGIEVNTTPVMVPAGYVLSQNYPNPFNPETKISYGLPFRSYVRLTVFNVIGREIAVLRDGVEEGGTKEAVWNGLDGSGESLPSGVYFFRIEAIDPGGSAAPFTQTRSMILLK